MHLEPHFDGLIQWQHWLNNSWSPLELTLFTLPSPPSPNVALIMVAKKCIRNIITYQSLQCIKTISTKISVFIFIFDKLQWMSLKFYLNSLRFWKSKVFNFPSIMPLKSTCFWTCLCLLVLSFELSLKSPISGPTFKI